ncbi:hypothetical protein KC853_02135, partial [Candidatus Saccharibacteria bacterium]|nr:hypothetical protein [Candidatus Saccharibacteria bacterium]
MKKRSLYKPNKSEGKLSNTKFNLRHLLLSLSGVLVVVAISIGIVKFIDYSNPVVVSIDGVEIRENTFDKNIELGKDYDNGREDIVNATIDLEAWKKINQNLGVVPPDSFIMEYASRYTEQAVKENVILQKNLYKYATEQMMLNQYYGLYDGAVFVFPYANFDQGATTEEQAYAKQKAEEYLARFSSGEDPRSLIDEIYADRSLEPAVDAQNPSTILGFYEDQSPYDQYRMGYSELLNDIWSIENRGTSQIVDIPEDRENRSGGYYYFYNINDYQSPRLDIQESYDTEVERIATDLTTQADKINRVGQSTVSFLGNKLKDLAIQPAYAKDTVEAHQSGPSVLLKLMNDKSYEGRTLIERFADVSGRVLGSNGDPYPNAIVRIKYKDVLKQNCAECDSAFVDVGKIGLGSSTNENAPRVDYRKAGIGKLHDTPEMQGYHDYVEVISGESGYFSLSAIDIVFDCNRVKTEYGDGHPIDVNMEALDVYKDAEISLGGLDSINDQIAIVDTEQVGGNIDLAFAKPEHDSGYLDRLASTVGSIFQLARIPLVQGAQGGYGELKPDENNQLVDLEDKRFGHYRDKIQYFREKSEMNLDSNFAAEQYNSYDPAGNIDKETMASILLDTVNGYLTDPDFQINKDQAQGLVGLLFACDVIYQEGDNENYWYYANLIDSDGNHPLDCMSHFVVEDVLMAIGMDLRVDNVYTDPTFPHAFQVDFREPPENWPNDREGTGSAKDGFVVFCEATGYKTNDARDRCILDKSDTEQATDESDDDNFAEPNKLARQCNYFLSELDQASYEALEGRDCTSLVDKGEVGSLNGISRRTLCVDRWGYTFGSNQCVPPDGVTYPSRRESLCKNITNFIFSNNRCNMSGYEQGASLELAEEYKNAVFGDAVNASPAQLCSHFYVALEIMPPGTYNSYEMLSQYGLTNGKYVCDPNNYEFNSETEKYQLKERGSSSDNESPNDGVSPEVGSTTEDRRSSLCSQYFIDKLAGKDLDGYNDLECNLKEAYDSSDGGDGLSVKETCVLINLTLNSTINDDGTTCSNIGTTGAKICTGLGATTSDDTCDMEKIKSISDIERGKLFFSAYYATLEDDERKEDYICIGKYRQLYTMPHDNLEASDFNAIDCVVPEDGGNSQDSNIETPLVSPNDSFTETEGDDGVKSIKLAEGLDDYQSYCEQGLEGTYLDTDTDDDKPGVCNGIDSTKIDQQFCTAAGGTVLTDETNTETDSEDEDSNAEGTNTTWIDRVIDRVFAASDEEDDDNSTGSGDTTAETYGCDFSEAGDFDKDKIEAALTELANTPTTPANPNSSAGGSNSSANAGGAPNGVAISTATGKPCNQNEIRLKSNGCGQRQTLATRQPNQIRTNGNSPTPQTPPPGGGTTTGEPPQAPDDGLDPPEGPDVPDQPDDLPERPVVSIKKYVGHTIDDLSDAQDSATAVKFYPGQSIVYQVVITHQSGADATKVVWSDENLDGFVSGGLMELGDWTSDTQVDDIFSFPLKQGEEITFLREGTISLDAGLFGLDQESVINSTAALENIASVD